MKMSKTLSLCLAAGLAVSSSLALAQGGPPPQGGPGGPHGAPPGHGPQKGHHGGPPPRAQGGPGPGEDSWQHPDWRKGDHVPQQFRDRQYVVDDYRQYHLDPPKRGYHWVGVSGDFLLVNGSGVILQIVPGGTR
ncbi:RcnB family protein [Pandoraea sp. NPDC087047]|uniref:RcnB family protein n=1 Tax=Pandoraea sp. NPDC087047 TaxID=3364390 RepID=UPI0037FBA3C8